MLYKLIFFFLITKFIFLIIISNVDLNENEKAYNLDLLCNCPVGFIKPRVVNGTRISRDDFKWLVLLYSLRDKNTVCTGSILSENTILTAAHCFKFDTSFNDTFVLGGSNNDIQSMLRSKANRRKIKKFYIHPSYDIKISYPNRFDAAIVILEEPFELGPKHNMYPVCLLSKQIFKPKNLIFYMSGFGFTKPYVANVLTGVSEPSINPNESYYLKLKYLKEPCEQFSDSFFCLKSDYGSACNADSGGPVHIIHKNKTLQAGILLSGKYPVINNFIFTCSPGSLNIASKITDLLCWIQALGRPICIEN